MSKIIYLDNSSTTQVSKEVVKEMNHYLYEEYGNPGSQHQMGERARKALDNSRKALAKEINAKSEEIIFASGATESNNLAILGLAKSNPHKKRIVISSIEHPSVYETAMYLKAQGYEIMEINVTKEGLLNLNSLKSSINSNTFLVSIIHANNEIGVLQDLEEIGKMCKEKNVLFHTDAVQSLGKERIDVKRMNISLLSASAHKIGGPKGIGLLYVKENMNLSPIIYGGGQEKGLRSGTENVSGAVGFAKSLELIKKIDKNKLISLRNYFFSELEKIGGKINGSKEQRLADNISVSLPCDAEMLVIRLSQKGIMCSTKSTCSEKSGETSRILESIGLTKEQSEGTIRFSLSDKINKKDVDLVINKIQSFLKKEKYIK